MLHRFISRDHDTYYIMSHVINQIHIFDTKVFPCTLRLIFHLEKVFTLKFAFLCTWKRMHANLLHIYKHQILRIELKSDESHICHFNHLKPIPMCFDYPKPQIPCKLWAINYGLNLNHGLHESTYTKSWYRKWLMVHWRRFLKYQILFTF